MKHLNKTICIFLSVIFLGLCGCGNSASAPAEPVQSSEPTSTPAAVLSTEEQIRLILSDSSRWLVPREEYTPEYFYAVTDLDRNGRLEILQASTQGTGIFTYGTLFEVNDSFTELKECPILQGEGDNLPEIIVSAADCYQDADGVYYYVFNDTARNGVNEIYSAKESLSLANGTISRKVIASSYSVLEGESYRTTYQDADGSEIDEARFNAAEEISFAGMQKNSVSLGWFLSGNADLQNLISQSWDVFSGNLPAMSEDATLQIGALVTSESVEAPVVTPQVQIPVGSSGNITVTKNPTSESLSIGGNTWFIAHASNATSLTWQFTDPEGKIYSAEETLSKNPGLSLQILEGDTIAVSNVPLSFNGWSVQAVFSDGQDSVATSPAAIYVGDFAAAYSSVLDRYRNAYASGTSLDYGTASAYEISEMAGYSTQAGYAMKDLNKDGIPELIVAGTGTDNHSENIVYEIDTLVNGAPVQLCLSQARARYYLLRDNSVYFHGSSGAAYSSFALYQFSGTSLVLKETVRSDLDDNAVAVWFYSAGSGVEESVSESYAYAKTDGWENSVYLPFLTPIS